LNAYECFQADQRCGRNQEMRFAEKRMFQSYVPP
jgi:hypothetical protein